MWRTVSVKRPAVTFPAAQQVVTVGIYVSAERPAVEPSSVHFNSDNVNGTTDEKDDYRQLEIFTWQW